MKYGTFSPFGGTEHNARGDRSGRAWGASTSIMLSNKLHVICTKQTIDLTSSDFHYLFTHPLVLMRVNIFVHNNICFSTWQYNLYHYLARFCFEKLIFSTLVNNQFYSTLLK